MRIPEGAGTRAGDDAERRDIGWHDDAPRDGARHDVVRHDVVRRDPARHDAALHDFVEGRRTALFRSAYLLCGDRHEAEDLVQSALVKVVLGGRRHGRLDNIEAYARKTLVNTFIASRRRFWRREQAYGELPDRQGPASDTDTGLVVRAALARLVPKQRAVLVLRYWEDLSVEATAEALGMRTNTVKSHAARGLAALRAGMAEELV